jgi:hypothetical protein
MTNAPSPPAAPHAAKPARHRRSETTASLVARAQTIAAALPALLSGVAKADAGAAHVRINAAWVSNLTTTIAAAQAAQGNRSTVVVGKGVATSNEVLAATSLESVLAKVRTLVETHNPADIAAQRAYGRGAKLNPRDIGGTLEAAQGFVAAWNGDFKQPAVNAGVTQATIDQISALATALAQAKVSHAAAATKASQETLNRRAAVEALQTQCAFATRVVTDVFGKGSPEVATLADPRPMQARGATRKIAAKAKAKSTAARVAAKKAVSRAKPGARAKARAGKAARMVVAARKAALLAGPAKKAAAKRARATGAKKKKAARAK